MNYVFAEENPLATYPEACHLYAQHYQEMKERLEAEGLQVSPYKPDVPRYIQAMRNGDLRHFTVRTETETETEPAGKLVGYCNLYVTKDMHNGDLIAQEDTIFIVKSHRNGVGRRFVKCMLGFLKDMGVKRVNVTALTDLRVPLLWRRLGFKDVGTAMTFYF